MKVWPLLLFVPASLARALHHSDGIQSPIQPDTTTSSAIRDTLVANKVIGDVLDDFEPSYLIEVSYPIHHESVLLGNDIPVEAVQKRPTFVIHAINSQADSLPKNTTFTLALTDPDAKSRDNPKWSEMCHWLITNLTTPLEQPLSPAKEAGELKGYKPPGPPPKTGAHRYVFVLLQGDATDLKPPKDRQHWGYGKVRHGVRDWAAEYDLEVVGANFFFAQDEEQ
jgi:phosphatidylethanolamine-binding protein